MSTVEEIEAAIQQLSVEERAKFRAWFAQFDADEWDRQIEADVKAGRLDQAGRQADADFEAGRCKPL